MDRSIKAARLADQIRDYISLWLHQEYLGEIFSVTQVTITPDLRIATVWIDLGETKHLLTEIGKREKHWQHLLNQQLNKKYFLQICFKEDSSRAINLTLDNLLKP